ncbi:hypothetical protein B0I37DRAFT_16021 [Chaetomium sp. MPI-CAGE-AT-0009]|nr:hypothetical protein B0I37DRAFT_16021 [Chaetomium sp. MPI-CAGE-AT-0009]
MRVTSIFLAAGLALFANAQTTTGNNAPSTTDGATAAQSSAQAAITRCLETCDPKDVNCRAKCLNVPFPNDQQTNNTNTCVAACPSGKNTETDNEAYKKCVSDCVAANYYDPSSGTPSPTGGAGSGSGSGSGTGSGSGSGSGNSDSDDSNNDDATGTGGNEGSQTSGAPSPSESTAGAALIGASSGVVGILGFVAAVMAL